MLLRLREMEFGRVEHGFTRDHRDRIYFLAAHGRETIPYPVLEDGSISRYADLDALKAPFIVVQLVHPEALGIAELHWTDAKPHNRMP